MTEDEARLMSAELLLGPLTEFEKIALAELRRETEGIDFPNVTSEQEAALARLGSFVLGKVMK